MSFFERPILNSPYSPPEQHWELDSDGRPTDNIIPKRRRSDLISAMPKPKSVKGGKQTELELSAAGLTGQDMAYNVTEFVNEMRSQVDAWRQLPNPNDWQVSPITQRLLQHWRTIQKDETQVIRPFFCQLEAVETAIWMTEVAPKMGERGRRVRRRLEAANAEANPDLFRVAMKLATGAGKTTVMAMLIAWQTLNAVRSPNLHEKSLTELKAKVPPHADYFKEYRSALITAAVTDRFDVEPYAKSGTPDRRLDTIQEETGA